MIEFVNGSEQQYAILKEDLKDHLCHVYNNCSYPPCCSKTTGRIGFEQEGDNYVLYIDKGVTCFKNDVPSSFLDWLSSGTIKFLEFTDMKKFLRSLKCLYH